MKDVYVALALGACSAMGLVYYYSRNSKKHRFTLPSITPFLQWTKKKVTMIVGGVQGSARRFWAITTTVSDLSREQSKNAGKKVSGFFSQLKMPSFNLSFLKGKRHEENDFLRKLLDHKTNGSNGAMESEGSTNGIEMSEVVYEKEIETAEVASSIATEVKEELSEKNFEEVEKKWVDAIIQDPNDIIAYKKLAKLYFNHGDFEYCEEILQTLIKLGAKDAFIAEYREKIGHSNK